MRGTVATFDWRKGSGVIVVQDENQRVPVTAADLAFKRGFLVDGEDVSFEWAETPAGRRAINVVLASAAKRWTGTVVMFERGCGFIRVEGRSHDVFAHHTSILGPEPRLLQVGDDVEFELSETGVTESAKAIVKLDTRGVLERFALWSSVDAHVAVLARLARPEKWDASRQGNAPPRLVLRHYLNDTFAQVQEEGRIAVATEAGGRPIASFNTGLVTADQEALYGYFEDNPDTRTGQKWVFLTFCVASDPRLYNFPALPDPATYFARSEELVYDTTRALVVDYGQLLRDVASRLAPGSVSAVALSRQTLEDAVKTALVRVRRNHNTAVPMYSNRSIGLLLPLCLDVPHKADLALVVARTHDGYGASSVLPLDVAYRYARLLARPDDDWLTP